MKQAMLFSLIRGWRENTTGCQVGSMLKLQLRPKVEAPVNYQLDKISPEFMRMLPHYRQYHHHYHHHPSLYEQRIKENREEEFQITINL